MSLRVLQNVTAISPGLSASFNASGGTAPYAFSVMAGGAGGTIDPTSGIYTAPATVSESAAQTSDFIQVLDATGTAASTSILIGSALLLFCDIIQNQMGLAQGRVYLWDQKIMQPTDAGLYVAVSVPTCRPFGNTLSFDGSGSGLDSIQSVNMMATVDVDLISRGPAARDQKELLLMALNSTYSEQQQEANSFYISRLPSGNRFINLSEIDGAAIPYRYKISMAMQFTVTSTRAVSYFDTFATPEVVTNS